MSKNIVLLIGAKGTVQPIEGAIDELYEIKEVFKKRPKGRRFQVEYESTLTRKILESALPNLRNDIRILHFAGHSSRNSIHMNDGEMSIQPIISYIKSWDTKPSLVFINGCNSSGQVNGFLEIGIPCVIATHNPIEDERAEKFAISFYKELMSEQQELNFVTAFNDAGVFLNDVSDRSPRTLDIEEIGQVDKNESNWDWGIFTKNTKWEEKHTINSILHEELWFQKYLRKFDNWQLDILSKFQKKTIYTFSALIFIICISIVFLMINPFNNEQHKTSSISIKKTELIDLSDNSSFTDLKNGVIFDKNTNLMWTKCSEGQNGGACGLGEIRQYRWEDAVEVFHTVTWAGYSDWRLPTIEELRTLIHCDNGTPVNEALDHGCIGEEGKAGQFSAPTIDRVVFPKTGPGRYWSSTTNQHLKFKAWVVSFYDGSDSALDKVLARRVRLVRINK